MRPPEAAAGPHTGAGLVCARGPLAALAEAALEVAGSPQMAFELYGRAAQRGNPQSMLALAALSAALLSAALLQVCCYCCKALLPAAMQVRSRYNKVVVNAVDDVAAIAYRCEP